MLEGVKLNALLMRQVSGLAKEETAITLDL